MGMDLALDMDWLDLELDSRMVNAELNNNGYLYTKIALLYYDFILVRAECVHQRVDDVAFILGIIVSFILYLFLSLKLSA